MGTSGWNRNTNGLLSLAKIELKCSVFLKEIFYLFRSKEVKSRTVGTMSTLVTSANEKFNKLSAPKNKATSRYKKNFDTAQSGRDCLKSKLRSSTNRLTF